MRRRMIDVDVYEENEEADEEEDKEREEKETDERDEVHTAMVMVLLVEFFIAKKAKLPMYPPELNKVHITTGAKLEMTFAPLRKFKHFLFKNLLKKKREKFNLDMDVRREWPIH